MENEDGFCQITDVGKIEGEASINNRKGKLIFFYEWTIKASWTGMFSLNMSRVMWQRGEAFQVLFILMFFLLGTSKSGIKYKGTMEVMNLSDENDVDDLDVSE